MSAQNQTMKEFLAEAIEVFEQYGLINQIFEFESLKNRELEISCCNYKLEATIKIVTSSHIFQSDLINDIFIK